MPLSRNIILADTETTGLDPENGCEVIEIYATAINCWNLKDHAAGPFHAIIKPQRPEKAEAGALKVVGNLWTEALTNGVDAKTAWEKFTSWCNSINDEGKIMTKPIIFGHNWVNFDRKFCHHHMKEYNCIKKSDYGWEFPWAFEFDTMQIFWMLFENNPDVNDLKLDTWLSKFNLKRKASTHSAEEDVELLKQLFVRSMDFLRRCQGKMRIN